MSFSRSVKNKFQDAKEYTERSIGKLFLSPRMGGNVEVMRNGDTRYILKRELTGFDDGLNWEEREKEKNQG